jgi:hypothetical protein
LLGNTSDAGFIATADAAVAGNVIENAEYFARQQYLDFLGREPDEAGFNFWINTTTSCGNNPQCVEVQRINLSAAFFLSIEFQQTGYLVERIHKVAYGDGGGVSSLNGAHTLATPIVRFDDFVSDMRLISAGVVVLRPGWQQLLEKNKHDFTSQFVQQPQFQNAFPLTMTPEQFVDRLNQNAGNVLSSSDRATAIALFGGTSDTGNPTERAQALRQIAENSNLYHAEFNRAFVLMQYFGYLRRNPNDQPDGDYAGYDFWLTKLDQFQGNFIDAEMVKAFLSSAEYRQRFGP